MIDKIKLPDDLKKALVSEIETISPKFNLFEPVMDYVLTEDAFKKRKVRDAWYASDLGNCPSGVYYDRLNQGQSSEIEPRTLRIFEMGHIGHGWVQSIATRSGLVRGIEEDLRVQDKSLNARGRADMLLQLDKYHILYDIKTVNSRMFWWNKQKGYVASPNHKQQLHFYYEHLSKLYPNMIMAMLYLSKDDLSVQEIFVEYDEKIIEENHQYFQVLQDAWKNQTPPTPVSSTSFDSIKMTWKINWKAKYCRYHHLCTGDPDWEKKALAEVKQKNSSGYQLDF